MKPRRKQNWGTTCHYTDGSVSYWNVYVGSWERRRAAHISDRVLATLNDAERRRIARLADEWAGE